MRRSPSTESAALIRKRLWRSVFFVVFFVGVNLAGAEPQVKRDPSGRSIAVSGLSEDANCHPFELAGIVVKREFAADALTLTGIVIEQQDGTRLFINVERLSDDLGTALKGSIVEAVQQLTRVGRAMRARVLACGAAGRVPLLESIK